MSLKRPLLYSSSEKLQTHQLNDDGMYLSTGQYGAGERQPLRALPSAAMCRKFHRAIIMSLFREIKAGPCFPKVINLTHAPLVEDEKCSPGNCVCRACWFSSTGMLGKQSPFITGRECNFRAHIHQFCVTHIREEGM